MVFMALNERPEVAEIALEGVRRLQRTHDVDLWCVCHTDEDYELAAGYGTPCMVDQFPVGRKFNQGLQKLKESGIQFDYLLQAGDDDVISPNTLDLYADLDADVLGGQKMHFWHQGEAYRYQYAPLSRSMMGGGRAISYRMLDACGWELWDDHAMQGLDMRSEMKLKGRGAKFELVDDILVVDIKHDRNIWNMDHYKRFPDLTEIPETDIRQITGVQIYDMIQNL